MYSESLYYSSGLGQKKSVVYKGMFSNYYLYFLLLYCSLQLKGYNRLAVL